MAHKALWASLLLLGFPIASLVLLRTDLLPTHWLGFPDGALAVALFMGLAVQGSPGSRLALALLAMAVCLAGLALRPQLTVGLLPVLVNLLLARLFQLTLQPGAEPLIARIARIARGEPALPPELAAYTRRLTAAWTWFFLALAANSLLLAVFASTETVILFANTLNLLFMAVFFLAENLYRLYRYRGRYRHTPLPRLLTTLVRHGWRGNGSEPAPDASSAPQTPS